MTASAASDVNPEGRPERWLVVASRFNATVVDRLLDGAIACLREALVPADAVTVIRVAGAFEVAQAAARACSLSGRAGRAGRADRLRGVVALAAVVRGETPHFDHVCSATTRALMDVALRSGIPIGFGVLTCDDLAQALARAGGEAGDKGREAAVAALDLARAFDALDAASSHEGGDPRGASWA